MNCKAGDIAMVVRAHPAMVCGAACIGRVIVKVAVCYPTFAGPAWTFEEGSVPCPNNPGACKISSFLDCELQPLPPEQDVLELDEEIEVTQ